MKRTRPPVSAAVANTPTSVQQSASAPTAVVPYAALPALPSAEVARLRSAYTHALFDELPSAVDAIHDGLTIGEPKDRARVGFRLFELLGVGLPDAAAANNDSGSKVASAAVTAAIEGMAKIAGIDAQHVADVLKSRQQTDRGTPRHHGVEDVINVQSEKDEVLAAFVEEEKR